MTDLRFAFRQLRKSPGVHSARRHHALGIGMNTAIFSLIHDLFLRGLPFADPDQLVILQAEAKERNLEQLPTSDMNGLPHTLGCSGNHPRTPGVDSIVTLQSKCFPNQKLTSTTT